MPSLWKFGGLTPLRLLRRVMQRMGENELSTRAAALSYYFVLALFPLMLFLVSLVGVIAGPGSQLRENIIAALGRLAPGSASALIHKTVSETFRSSGGVKLAAGLLGSLWAASGGMGAVIISLNVIYGVNESRPWWKKSWTAVWLTIVLSGLIITALVLVLYGGKIGDLAASHLGLTSVFHIAWKIVQWPLSLFAMFLSFSVVYYFAPNLEERRWYWVTPGAVAGVLLWLSASIGFRIYLHFFNSYSATYGSLGAVIILLLWLYLTGYAVLIGGEVNYVIESTDKHTEALEEKKQELHRQLEAA